MEQTLSFIHGLYRKGVKPGLERIGYLCNKLGNPQEKLKFIHIAGTNGKGSTASMTASILKEAGYKVGLFTSPYIYRFNERMQINGVQIPDERVIALTKKIRALTAEMPEMPTEFDFVTAMAFDYFAAEECDIVVLEVGVGGALDSTNIIPKPLVSVIVNIGLEHTDLLGNTLEEIAAVKAGIVKPGGHAVFYPGTPSVNAFYQSLCKEKHCNYAIVDFQKITPCSHGLEGQTFHWDLINDLQIPLLGGHQLCNAAVVLTTIKTLQQQGWKIEEAHIRAGLQNVTWPGRFEIVARDPLFIIDGGHNPQCIEALVGNIKDYLKDRKVIALTGVLADKDYGEMFRPVMPLVEQFVCITPDNPRKMEAHELARYLEQAGTTAIGTDTVEEGVALARKLAGKDGVVLCFGSLYSIGDIRNAL